MKFCQNTHFCLKQYITRNTSGFHALGKEVGLDTVAWFLFILAQAWSLGTEFQVPDLERTSREDAKWFFLNMKYFVSLPSLLMGWCHWCAGWSATCEEISTSVTPYSFAPEKCQGHFVSDCPPVLVWNRLVFYFCLVQAEENVYSVLILQKFWKYTYFRTSNSVACNIFFSGLVPSQRKGFLIS